VRSRLPALAAGLLVLTGLVWNLGGYALLEPDEGRNAEVMRELAVDGPWWLPQLNHLPYLDKPIVQFAAGGATIRLFGATEWAVRLPSLLFTLATLAVIAAFARRIVAPEAGRLTAIVTAATPFTLAYARTVIFDAALTCWITMALCAFYLAVEDPGGRDRTPRWAYVAWAAIALGVLTKGPVALAVPLLVAVPFAAWRKRLAVVLDPGGMLILLLVVLPWVFAVTSRVPDFARYVLVVETIQRVGSDALGRSEPWWYFPPILFAAALPWSVLLARAVPDLLRAARARRLDPRVVFALLWVLAPLVLFSLSRAKRPQYVLPLIPPLALLVTLWWRRRTGGLAGARVAGAALAAIGGALLALARVLPGWFSTSADVAALIGPTAVRLGALTLVAGIGAVVLASRDAWALPALVLPIAAIPLVAMPLMRAVGEDRSSRTAAETLRFAITAQTEVVAVQTYPLSLPFYLGRTLTLATTDGRELTSNYFVRHQAAMRRLPGSPLRPADWWREALATCDRPRLFLVPTDRRDLRGPLAEALPLVVETRTFAAYGPCGGGALAQTPR
jgi:4-amino-4-deoxy-L-arabinose transferase-like glycosyltransferase